MAQYVQATNFTSKDALLTGDPNKIVKGAEINDEFSAIQTAVNSKADTLSPTLTGTPLAPTATAGTVSTQIATTAFVDTAVTSGVTTGVTNGITNERSATATLTNKTLTDAVANTQAFGNSSTKLATTAFVQAGLQAAVQSTLQAVYPVGSIYVSTTATNPATTFGFGTWTAFGAGRVLVGQDTGDSSFNTLEETGGSKNATLVSHNHTGTTGGQSANHVHAFTGTTDAQGNHQHGVLHNVNNGGATYAGGPPGTNNATNRNSTTAGLHAHNVSGTTAGVSSDHSHSFTTSTQGSSATNANLQPYVVVKMWKRTA